MASTKRSYIAKIVCLLVVVGLVGGGYAGRNTVAAQRILGKREDYRIEAATDSGRPAFAGAVIVQNASTVTHLPDGSVAAVRVLSEISIDRASSTATRRIMSVLDRSDPNNPGVVTANVNDPPPQVQMWTFSKDAMYVSGAQPTDPWIRTPVGSPILTPASPYFILTLDDVIGFELAATTAVVSTADLAALAAEIRPILQSGDSDGTVTPPPAPQPIEVRQYSMTAGDLKRMIPTLYTYAELDLRVDTPITLRLGFDAERVLRFASISLERSAAEQRIGDGVAVYGFTMVVSDLSDSPMIIALPTNVVDAPPAG